MSKNYKSFDWVGYWYVLSKKIGNNTGFVMGLKNLESGSIRWSEFDHADCDGLGAIAKILRSRGESIDFQVCRTSPSILNKIFFTFKEIIKYGGEKTSWKNRDYQVPDKENLKEISHLVLDQKTRSFIFEKSKTKGISITSLYLNALDKVIRGKYVLAGTPTKWLYPVNMRDVVMLDNDEMNHSSAVGIEFTGNEDIISTKRKISFALKSGEHWGKWWLLNMGRLIGEKGVKYIYSKVKESSEYTGNFTYLGQIPGNSLHKQETLLVTSPASKNYPISFVAVDWYSNFTLNLKIHPSICKTNDEEMQVLLDISNYALKELNK